MDTAKGSQARRDGLRRTLSGLAGAVGDVVLTGIDPDDVIARIDVQELLRRIDFDEVLARVDLNELLRNVDVDAIASRLDVDAIVARIDVNAPLTRVDANALVVNIDLDSVLDRVDVDRLLAHVDVDGLLDRVDVNRLLARVNVDALLDRVHVDALLARASVNELMARVDVDALLGRVDIQVILQRAGVPELIRSSTQEVAGSVLDVARRQAVGLDVVVLRTGVRMLGRDPGRLPAGPAKLVDTPTKDLRPPTAGPPSFDVTGRYAGPVTRLVTDALDAFGAVATFTLLSAGVRFVLATVFGATDPTGSGGTAWAIALGLWTFAYYWVSLALTGRTLASALVGLRVVARDGSPLGPLRCAVRVLAMPLSTLAFGLGYVGLVVDRERRTLHDVLAGSVAVYDWGRRTATLPTPLGRWIERRGAE